MKITGIPFETVHENELVSIPDAQMTKYDDADFDSMGSSFTPRLQLMTAASELCKKNEFPMNHYAIVKDGKYQDIGEVIEVIVLAWRPKALDMSDPKGEIMSSFDLKDDEFKRIKLKSEGSDSGCMWGFEFLVYVSEHEAFATFFMGSASARREAPSMKSQMLKGATLKSRLIESKKYSWFAPVITPCSSPLEAPEQEKLEEEIEKFNNPPKDDRETVTENDERAR